MWRAALLLGSLWAASAEAACRQALALGLDISGSVDAREYRLQLDGLAGALEDAQVEAALLTLPQAPVWLLVYEWSGTDNQRLLVPWTAIADRTALRSITGTLRSTQRAPASTSTAIGAAMLKGAAHLREKSDCWALTLDISGDGKSNTGPIPAAVGASPALRGIVVNGLVIGQDVSHNADARQLQIGELSSYYNAVVIRGPGAFVETALGFEDYQRAMTRKLRREIRGLEVSEVMPGDQ